MENEPTRPSLSVQQFVELESRVWDALVAGDPEADAAMLTDDFVGVYESGISGKAKHCKQLENGPTVERYQILEPRILVVSESAVMLSYLAEWTKPGGQEPQKMYISSLWQKAAGAWKNSFSQDTMAAD